MQPAFSEPYTFYCKVNDGARLWVDGAMLFDGFENDLGEEGGFVELSGATPLALVADLLVDIKLEYRENAGAATVQLYWSSSSQPYALVPSSRLFHMSTPIASSPFAVAPTAAKPPRRRGQLLPHEPGRVHTRTRCRGT